MLIRIGVLERDCNRMGRIALDVRCKMQKLRLIELVRMYCIHLELPFRESPCLVEDDGAELRERVHIVRAFDENAVLRRASDTTEECQRD